jgi:chromate transporter
MQDYAHKASVSELFRFFLILGLTAFGGPVAHLAIIQREAVEKRGWLSKEEFLDVFGLLNLIPGPNSTQMVMYFGHRHGGVLGMLVAGLAFILPAALITLGLSIAYLQFGALPQGQAVMWGIQPVVVAVIAAALWRLVPTGLNSWPKRIIFGAAVVASLVGFMEVAIILGAGAVGWLWLSGRSLKGASGVKGFVPLAALAGFGPTLGSMGVHLAGVFLVFLKMALVLYGSGYLLVAYMQADLVDRLGWLTMQQMLDVLAIGQMTPGPFLTTATAAGMVMAGLPGALAATVGIFLPSFFLIGILGKRVQSLRSSAWGKDFLMGVNAAVVAVLLIVALRFIRGLATDSIRPLLAVLSLYALEKWKVNSMLLIAIGAVLGLAAHFLL